MTARVLVVDDIPANVKLLQARLSAEYFDVITAYNGRDAVELTKRERVDIVLLDVMMPGMDGFEACRLIKADAETGHIPVVMVTALDQPADRVQGLESGADDFLTKPVDEVALITRVKNLARLKVLNDEMMLRSATGRWMGLNDDLALSRALAERPGHILIVDDDLRTATRMFDVLCSENDVHLASDSPSAVACLDSRPVDVMIVNLATRSVDGLQLCGHVRAAERTRHVPIIIVVDPDDRDRLLRGLDMGINDYVMAPIDRNELKARVKTQLRRLRYSEHLRERLGQSVEHAVTDALTGLANRRYMEGHLETLVAEARASGRSLSLLIADIDHFKQVNDTYGHDAGDIVLREFSTRLKTNTRGGDLACRLGGEEFVVIMPDTNIVRAYQVGERLRACIAAEPFGRPATAGGLRITASVGVAALAGPADTPRALLKRADEALYAAKRRGRNRVAAPAA
jgi:two-component system cell cycle response regulator